MGHDGHIAVACGDCRYFAHAYPAEQDDARLRGWGSCRRPGGATPPTADVIGALRSAVLGTDRQALRGNRAGLYRSEPEDGCEYFEGLVPTRHAVAGGR